MSLIKWNDSWSVRVPQLDQQHQRLVAMINELHDAMTQRRGRDALKKLFGSLSAYVAVHFRDEERYMQGINYPRLNEHKAEHDKFTQRVHELSQAHEGGQLTVTLETMNFLQDWLVNHIQRVDRQYAPAAAPTGAKA